MQQPVMILKNNISNIKGYIFDIQGLSVHDGPGCRTLIFLKGCTLNCFWCSNPEGISRKPSLMHYSSKCIICGNCVENCSQNAIRIANDKIKISRDLCTECKNQSCVNECFTEALKLCGSEITVTKLLEIIRRDRQFWGSEGGITLTGGEPLLQIDFVKEILSECHQAYIHTAVETCGNVPWKNFQQVISYVDWIFYDLKHFNSYEHKKTTGSDNSLILKNARQLSENFKGRLIFRFPFIPHYNDSKENIDAMISFIKETGRNEINMLPLHHLGREKYQMLNQDYYGDNFPVPTHKDLQDVKNVFNAAGINCYLGSETPF